MLVAWHRLASVFGIAALLLSLPACSTLPQAPAPATPPAHPEPTARGSQPSEPIAPAPSPQSVAESHPPGDGPVQIPRDFMGRLDDDIDLSLEDYRHYWSPLGLGLFAGGLAAAAPLANTSADEDIRRWYLDKVRSDSKGLDTLSDVANIGGQLWVVAPLCFEGAVLAGCVPEDARTDGGVYEWSNRSLRAVAVGFPPVVALYFVLGAGRPDRGDSHWHPFRDIHGVSGHTFMGAVPFLTAAAMTDDPFLQAPLIAGSFLTGWSRFREDRHFFSQIALGWWMAYLAVRSVSETDLGRSAISITPGLTPEGPGVTLQVRY